LSHGSEPFKAHIKIPELKINARYTSSGVLIILPASGQGNFHSTLGMSPVHPLYHTRRSVLSCGKGSELYYRTDTSFAVPQSLGRVG